jgi:uncharacterized protein (TIGR02271 family)
MAKTVVGLMDTAAEAERVVSELTRTCRCDRADIGLMARGSDADIAQRDAAADHSRHSGMAHGAMKGAGTGAAVGGVLGLVAGVASRSIPGFGPFIAAGPIAAALAGAGVGAAAGGIIGALVNIGVPEEHAHYYAEGVRRGGTLVTVHARTDDVADCAANVMRQHGAVDIDERAEHWKREGWKGRLDQGADTGAEGEVLPVAREELVVGKRPVSHGGVRVYTQVVEKPVEQTVRLREEHVDVERRPVDRPLVSGEDAFRERTIEVRETVEEPVVSKRAHVVEEVVVRKEALEHDETVRDTVRKTEVNVDRTPGAPRATRGYTGAERRRSANTAAYRGPERRVAA